MQSSSRAVAVKVEILQQNMKVQELRNLMTSLQQCLYKDNSASFNVNPYKVLSLGKTSVIVAHKIAGIFIFLAQYPKESQHSDFYVVVRALRNKNKAV